MRAYHVAVGDAPFLYYEEVTLYLGQISEDAAELKKLTSDYDDMPPGQERSAAIQVRYDHFNKLRAMRDKAIPLFAPYLDARPTTRPISMQKIRADFLSEQKAATKAAKIKQKGL